MNIKGNPKYSKKNGFNVQSTLRKLNVSWSELDDSQENVSSKDE